MSISIHKSGVLDTIQDAGRNGFAASGINPSGAMDLLAMQIANALVGNHLNEAVFELHFPAGIYHFNMPALVALSGADFTAFANGVSLPINKTIFIPANTSIYFNHKVWGERCYMAVRGGINTPGWLGSKATHLKLDLNGHLSQSIKKGDVIQLNKNMKVLFELIHIFSWKSHLEAWYQVPEIINILQGPEWEYLTNHAQKDFISTQYQIHVNSDRMALQLIGLALEKQHKKELISSAVGYGTIQLLNNGLPIVLMADHQTTGGYPRIAQVITAHLPKLSQLSPHTKTQFIPTTLAKAEALLFSQFEEVRLLQQAVLLKLANVFI